ncbi:acyl-CoA dehydrogenase [Spongiibacter tropicus]|uniref:acyl-CoA dehydrogenase n=1 Tax=Spongiibacter tropicus TaxID=454602 RepID=UPI0003B52A2B|nr:acyl-CoA dehydrogenase [Spongiibacter tropicus]
MTAPLLNERDIAFMLYEFLNCESLCERERYADHNRESFDAAIATARSIAERYFLPIRGKVDRNEPRFEDGRVVMLPEVQQAVQAATDAGFVSATADYDVGGMQLPLAVAAAANAWLSAAGSTTIGYLSLSSANASLIEAHGSTEQIAKWAAPLRSGRFAGTMAMTEPGAGSGLADLITRAEPAGDGSYRITGNKIFISGGDHELNDNIVHLVLARVKGAPKGVKGISLFIVPKYLVNDDGSLGERNDVALAGLFHKMGGRGHTSTSLNFGEQGGAVGYLIGEENRGLSYMFHMMNEARIMVASGAATLALAGFQYSLNYARERAQGRLPSCKDPHSPPVSIVEHADVRRMLLTQKAYAEGAFALCLYGAQLADDQHTAADAETRDAARLLLDFLTPIIKTWPSEQGPKANSLAIQVLGGAGYTNEHPVEMFYRDNRLNPIHEGTTGIQSLDLLARKVPMHGMAGYQACLKAIRETIAEAQTLPPLAALGGELEAALRCLEETTQSLLTAMGSESIDRVLANSVSYLDMFGQVVMAWIWLKQGCAAQQRLATAQGNDADFYRGKLQALRYFFAAELPKIQHWSNLLKNLESSAFEMQDAWF